MTECLLKNSWHRKKYLISVVRSEFRKVFHNLWSHQEIQNSFWGKHKHLKYVRRALFHRRQIMNTFLVTETESEKAQACVHCVRWPESLDCANPHICLHCLTLSVLGPGYWCDCWCHTGASGRCGWNVAHVSWHHREQHLPRNQHAVHCGEKSFSPWSQTLASGYSISFDCRWCVHPLQETLISLLETQKATEPWGWGQCVQGRHCRNISLVSLKL